MPRTAVDKGDGVIVGILPDGRVVVVRDVSTEGVPTVEVQEGNKRLRIRYLEREKEEKSNEEEPRPKEEQ